QGFERTRVRPPAFENRVRHYPFADIRVIDVSDLQFAAAGWFQNATLIEDRSVVQINPGNGEIALRSSRLFLNPDDLRATQLGDPESLRVGYFLEEDARAAFLLAEFLNGRPDVSFDQVVAQDDADLVPIGEVLGERQRFSDSAFAFLIGVIQMLQSKFFS